MNWKRQHGAPWLLEKEAGRQSWFRTKGKGRFLLVDAMGNVPSVPGFPGFPRFSVPGFPRFSNKGSQRKFARDREESYRRETQPGPSMPKPGTPGYIDLSFPPGPYVPMVFVRAWQPTPPPRLDPADCLVPDAKGYHENAMLAWELKNGLPLSPSGSSDVNGGEGVSATYVQMKGGRFMLEIQQKKSSRLTPSLYRTQAQEEPQEPITQRWLLLHLPNSPTARGRGSGHETHIGIARAIERNSQA